MNQQQGTIFSKIAMPIVIVAIVVYLICSAWVGIRDPYQFTVAYTDTMETSVDAAGWVVRSEQPVAGAEGVVQLKRGQGEKVAKGKEIAVVYQDETYVENQEELLQVKNDLSALQYATYSESPSGTALEDQMLSAMTSLRTAASSGNYSSLSEQTETYRKLVLRREYLLSSEATAAMTQAAADLQARYDDLQSYQSGATSIKAQESGLFSSYVDGYETLLTPDKLETITAAELTQLARQQPEADPNAVGKLITDATWYFVFAASSEEAQRLHQGSSVTVRFSRDWSGEVDMTVERVGEPEEDGQCAVVLSTDRYLSETTLLRRQTVELVFDSREGIRVPTESIRVVEQTVTDPETEEESQVLTTGVFVLVGQQAEVKPVTVVEQMEEFALVVPADGVSDSEALRAGDQIILSSVELTDGAVILDS